MSVRWSRTLVAAVLTTAGVIVPCAAWYLAGSRAARQQASRLAAVPREQARLEAGHLAEQIALRLESLRESESRRPFQDYLGERTIAAEDCGIDPLGPSPLAQGPVDPLIWTHFQIDEVGVLTLPTMSGDEPDSPSATDAIQQSILNELECASPQHLAALRRPTGDEAGRQWSSPRGVVTVGPFSWHTASIDGAPALVALREVATPEAVLTEGFVVPTRRVESLLTGSIHPATILPGPAAADDLAAAVPLQGDAWSVRVDASRALDEAVLEGRRVEARFRRTFVLGALAACLAGCAVVLMVRHSERVARERDRFAAAAAHELRTPLAGLQLYGEMLADQVGDPARREAYARRIAAEAQRLGRVVSNVLGFAHLSRDGLAVTPRDAELEPAVRACLERLRPTIEAGGARVELKAERPIGRARFDADALHQILQNLLDNAQKFNRDSNDRTIEVRLDVENGRPGLSVRDHGPGVDPKLRRRLFRPFSRDPDPRSPTGLGIGLALVRALAEAEGATVTHRRPAEGGALFCVRFAPVEAPDLRSRPVLRTS